MQQPPGPITPSLYAAGSAFVGGHADIRDDFRVGGWFELEHRRGGEVIDKRTVRNLIPTAGKAATAGLLVGIVTDFFDYPPSAREPRPPRPATPRPDGDRFGWRVARRGHAVACDHERHERHRPARVHLDFRPASRSRSAACSRRAAAALPARQVLRPQRGERGHARDHVQGRRQPVATAAQIRAAIDARLATLATRVESYQAARLAAGAALPPGAVHARLCASGRRHGPGAPRDRGRVGRAWRHDPSRTGGAASRSTSTRGRSGWVGSLRPG